MKRTMQSLVLIMGLLPGSMAAQTDTLVINHPDKVTVITNDSLQRIIVSGRQGDPHFSYQSSIQLVDSNYVSNTRIGHDRWELIPSIKLGKSRGNEKSGHSNAVSAHLGVGFTCPSHVDERVDFSTFRSWEIFATLLQWDHYLDRKEKNCVSLGFGVDWRNYRMTGERLFTKGADGKVTVGDYQPDQERKFSRIKVFSLTTTLRYELNLGNGFAIGLGPVVNFNTYASIKTRYKLNGDKVKHMEKDIHQRPVTIDWMLNANIADVPLYLKYSGNDVLKEGGVKFRSLSFGLYL